MNPSHYRDKKHFRIYALTNESEGPCAYVGKTTGRRLSAVYSRHRTGSVAATAGDFDQVEKPRMYLLESIYTDTSTAYSHIVAWAYIFEEAGGYALLNSDGTCRHVEHLQPETKAIVDELCREPLEEVLKRTYLAKPSDGDLPPEPVPEPEAPGRATAQMNIRINREDRESFDRFCKDGGLTQRKGFSVLLDRATSDRKNDALLAITRRQKGIIREQNQQIEELKQKLLEYQADGGSQREQKLKEKLEQLRLGIGTYFSLLSLPKAEDDPLPEGKYRRFIRSTADADKPVYPENDGFFVLALERLLWSNGRSPCFFLIGTGEDGRCYKLRCYPRQDHVGLRVRDYAEPGARWLLGCQRSSDGAMDLIAAFPLPDAPAEESQPAGAASPGPSLDALIKRAEKRR